MVYRLPLVFEPQPDGGYCVSSPVLPELHTDGDTFEEAFHNVGDALAAVIELYADFGRQLPEGILPPPAGRIVWTDALVST